MEKKMLLAGITLFTTLYCLSQSIPAKWDFNAKKIANKTYELRFIATVQAPWHIYSQTTPDGWPLPTKISFIKNPLLTLQRMPKENGKILKKYEDVFEVDVIYFDHNAEFVQLVKLKSNAKTRISGTIQFMACNDEQCLPPAEVPFGLELN